MASIITQLCMGDNKNFWTRGFKIPIAVLTMNFSLIIET